MKKELADLLAAIRQDERERLFEWGKDICPHTSLDPPYLGHIYKHKCSKCWQALKATVKKEM